jgi:peptidoglycan-N-acetylglucosamine deacetylase
VNKGTASVLPKIIDFLQKQGYSCEAYDPEAHFPVNFWKDNRL